jgi:hypothetical protein
MYNPCSGSAFSAAGGLKVECFCSAPGRFPIHQLRGLRKRAPRPKICQPESTRPMRMDATPDGCRGCLTLTAEKAYHAHHAHFRYSAKPAFKRNSGIYGNDSRIPVNGPTHSVNRKTALRSRAISDNPCQLHRSMQHHLRGIIFLNVVFLAQRRRDDCRWTAIEARLGPRDPRRQPCARS